MAFKYFNSITELTGVYTINPKEFAERFPGATSRRGGYGHFIGRPVDIPITGMNRAEVSALYVPVERIIDYKKQPSLHKCDARCQNATGRVMKCECRCGGKYHGVGFSAEEV